MKKIKKAIILVVTIFSFISVNAQQKTVIRGRVIDKADKTTIIGANIVEYDKDERVVNGNRNISAIEGGSQTTCIAARFH